MAGDIEAFLKMAAERRKQAAQNQGGGAQRPQPAAPQAYQPPPPRQVKQRPVTHQNQQNQANSQSNQPYRPPAQPQVQPYQAPVEIVEAIPLPPSNDPYFQEVHQNKNVYQNQAPRSRLVNQEVSSLDISSHAEQLGDKLRGSHLLAEAESRFGGHDTTYDQKVVDYGLAGEVIRMLTQPKSVASAIVLNEILKRPDFD